MIWDVVMALTCHVINYTKPQLVSWFVNSKNCFYEAKKKITFHQWNCYHIAKGQILSLVRFRPYFSSKLWYLDWIARDVRGMGIVWWLAGRFIGTVPETLDLVVFVLLSFPKCSLFLWVMAWISLENTDKELYSQTACSLRKQLMWGYCCDAVA